MAACSFIVCSLCSLTRAQRTDEILERTIQDYTDRNERYKIEINDQELADPKVQVITDISEKELAGSRIQVISDRSDLELAESIDEVITDISEKELADSKVQVITNRSDQELAESSDQVITDIIDQELADLIDQDIADRGVEDISVIEIEKFCEHVDSMMVNDLLEMTRNEEFAKRKILGVIHDATYRIEAPPLPDLTRIAERAESNAAYISLYEAFKDTGTPWTEDRLIDTVNTSSPDELMPEGYTLLHTAAEVGNVDIIKILIRNRIHCVNDESDNFDTVLRCAITGGNTETVVLLVENGARLKLLDRDGYSYFHTSAARGNLNVIRSIGLYIDVKDLCINISKKRLSVFHTAAQAADVTMVKYLLGEGFSANWTPPNRFNPLHFAALTKVSDVAKLRKQVDPSRPELFVDKVIAKDIADVVRTIIERKGKVNRKAEKEVTPLHCAAQNGYLTVMRLLLRAGANLHAETAQGLTALHYAVCSGNPGAVELLCEWRADLCSVTSDGLSLFHFAARVGEHRVVKALIDAFKPIPEITDKLQPLINQRENRFRLSPLHYAATGSHPLVVRALIREGADVNATDANENTALHLAAGMAPNNGVVLELIENRADVNRQNLDGNTCLHLAATLSSVPGRLALLAGKSADLSIKNKHRLTAGHMVSYKRSRDHTPPD